MSLSLGVLGDWIPAATWLRSLQQDRVAFASSVGVTAPLFLLREQCPGSEAVLSMLNAHTAPAPQIMSV